MSIDLGKALFIPLKIKFFEAFKSGSKTREFRKISKQFNLKTCVVGRKVILSKGYGKSERLTGIITKVEICDNPNELDGWVECYGTNEKQAIIITIEVE